MTSKTRPMNLGGDLPYAAACGRIAHLLDQYDVARTSAGSKLALARIGAELRRIQKLAHADRAATVMDSPPADFDDDLPNFLRPQAG